VYLRPHSRPRNLAVRLLGRGAGMALLALLAAPRSTPGADATLALAGEAPRLDRGRPLNSDGSLRLSVTTAGLPALQLRWTGWLDPTDARGRAGQLAEQQFGLWTALPHDGWWYLSLGWTERLASGGSTGLDPLPPATRELHAELRLDIPSAPTLRTAWDLGDAPSGALRLQADLTPRWEPSPTWFWGGQLALSAATEAYQTYVYGARGNGATDGCLALWSRWILREQLELNARVGWYWLLDGTLDAPVEAALGRARGLFGEIGLCARF